MKSRAERLGSRALAVWLTVIALLTLLGAPVLAGKAHAAMVVETAPAPMAGMVHSARSNTLSTPRHEHETTACAVACALAAQLMQPAPMVALSMIGPVGQAEYARLNRRPSGTIPERSTPPPR